MKPVSPKTKKVYVRRDKSATVKPNTEIDASFSNNTSPEKKKIMVARKIKFGQSIKVGNKTISMPLRDAESSRNLRIIPASTLVPQINQDKKEWNILGSKKDFQRLEEKYGQKDNLAASNIRQHAREGDENVDDYDWSGEQNQNRLATLRQSQRKAQRKLEDRKEREMLMAMSFEERIIATKDRRALKRWKASNEKWQRDADYLARNLGKHPSDLVMNAGEEFRSRMEEYSLLEQTRPLHEKYGPFQWQLSLRNHYEMSIPIGNEFSGLYSTVRANPTHKHSAVFKTMKPDEFNNNITKRNMSLGMYAKKRDRTKSWENSEYLKAKHKSQYYKIKKLLPAASKHSVVMAKEEDIDNTNSLYNLAIIGTDLFDIDGDIDNNQEEQDGNNNYQDEKNQFFLDLQATRGNNKNDNDNDNNNDKIVLVDGPSVEVDQTRLLFECVTDNTCTNQFMFRNNGNTALYYDWIWENNELDISSLQPRTKEQLNNFANSVDYIFDLLDEDGNGLVSCKELSNMINKSHSIRQFLDIKTSSKRSINDIMNDFEKTNENMINRDAFRSYFSIEVTEKKNHLDIGGDTIEEHKERLIQFINEVDNYFMILDENGDGKVSTIELINRLTNSYKIRQFFSIQIDDNDGNSSSLEELLHNMLHIDNGQNSITRDEFRSFLGLDLSWNSSSSLNNNNNDDDFNHTTNTHDMNNVFFGLETSGVLLPGQSAKIILTFAPKKSCFYLQSLSLKTAPQLPIDKRNVQVILKGVAVCPDENKVAREDMFKELELDVEESSKHPVLDEELTRINILERDPNEYHRLFHIENSDKGLFYYADSFNEFQQLATDVFNCHKRFVRVTSQWDFNVESLKKWIDTIPLRNEHLKSELLNRWQTLVDRCSIRPQPNPKLYSIMSSLLMDGLKQVPRLSHELRAANNVLDVPIEEYLIEQHNNNIDDDDNHNNIQRKSSRRGQQQRQQKHNNNNIDDDESEEKKLEKEQLLQAQNIRHEEYLIEKNKYDVREENYKNELINVTSNIFKSVISQFDYYTSNTHSFDDVLNHIKIRKSLPETRLSIWGNGILLPDLGIKRETDRERREREDKERRQRFNAQKNKNLKTEKRKYNLLDSYSITAAHSSNTHIVICTSNNLVYTWPTIQVEKKDTKKKPIIKKKVPATPSSKKKSSKSNVMTMNNLLSNNNNNNNIDDNKDIITALANNQDQVYPNAITIPELQGFDIEKVLCGNDFTVFLTQDGDVFFWPPSSQYYLNDLVEKEKTSKTTKNKPTSDKKILDKNDNKSSSNDLHSNNNQYNDDNNNNITNIIDEKIVNGIIVPRPGARLGCNDKDENGNIIPRIKATNIVDIAIGQSTESRFTICCDKNGHTYTWGENNKNMILGHGDKKHSIIPRIIESLNNIFITQVACGISHILVLCSEGNLYTWGSGDCGLLGLSDKKGRTVPTRIPTFGKHNNNSKRPGSGRSGRHRSSSILPSEDFQTNINNHSNSSNDNNDNESTIYYVQQIACGAHHSIAVTKCNKVFTWGKGSGGVLGHGDTKDVDTPKIVTSLINIKVTQVAAGLLHSMALAGDQIFSWGSENGGNLGHGNEDDITIPTPIQSITDKEIEERAVWLESHSQFDEEGKVSRTIQILAGGSCSFALRKRLVSIEEDNILLSSSSSSNR